MVSKRKCTRFFFFFFSWTRWREHRHTWWDYAKLITAKCIPTDYFDFRVIFPTITAQLHPLQTVPVPEELIQDLLHVIKMSDVTLNPDRSHFGMKSTSRTWTDYKNQETYRTSTHMNEAEAILTSHPEESLLHHRFPTKHSYWPDVT